MKINAKISDKDVAEKCCFVPGCHQLCAASVHPPVPQGVADDVRSGQGTLLISSLKKYFAI